MNRRHVGALAAGAYAACMAFAAAPAFAQAGSAEPFRRLSKIERRAEAARVSGATLD